MKNKKLNKNKNSPTTKSIKVDKKPKTIETINKNTIGKNIYLYVINNLLK